MSSSYRSQFGSQSSRSATSKTAAPPASALQPVAATPVSDEPVIVTPDSRDARATHAPNFSWKHFAANIMYIFSFLFLIVLTVLIWVMQSRIKEPGAQTPGAAFNAMLTTCAILGTVALVMLFLSVMYYKPGLVGYNHYKKHYAHL